MFVLSGLGALGIAARCHAPQKARRLRHEAAKPNWRKQTPTKLFFYCSCFFIEAVRAMPATTFAAMAAFEVVFFCKAFVAFGGKIKILSFDGFIFVILLIHLVTKIETLDRMFLIVTKYLIPKGYRGMTVFPFVILREKDGKQNAVLVNHEKIHIRQQLELLVLPFFIWYGVEFLLRWIQFNDKNLAYRNISFEREAYANEKDLNYLKSRSFWKFLNFV